MLDLALSREKRVRKAVNARWREIQKCRVLSSAGRWGVGGVLSKQPAQMPWGWKHAYLNDPDGHNVSLYWAGAKGLKKNNPF